ncbi:hypothetical protein LCM23_25215 [Cytobacillus kochii]|uniref:hypothetical protein n=1 Tax=Cytobacillus kochii TaxID=859143 RepID=UPI001CD6921F|nr:hypothetical protein [Cytobacillus kochii]MCA1029316.1 hypothetical protein [Cytobacillus kochii]
MPNAVEQHRKAVRQINKMHLRESRNVIYISFEDLPDTEIFWSEKEVATFDHYWKLNITIEGIAKMMRRSESSVMLLGLDRMIRGKVPARDWNIW